MTTPSFPEPITVLRARWRLLAIAGVVGGVAGIVAARVVPPMYEVQDVLILGSVGSDPMHPGSRIPLQNADEIVAFLKAGDRADKFEVDAQQEGGWMVRLFVRGRDRDGARQLCDQLLTKIETDHRAIYDGWQKQTGALQASLEKQPTPDTATAMARLDSNPLTGPQQANLIATVRGPVYSRPTARVAEPWIVRAGRHQARAAIAGAFAAVLFAWLAAFALSAPRSGSTT